MGELVLFYSFTGQSRKIAEQKAIKLGADILEIKESKKRSAFNAYTAGCFQAVARKKVGIEKIEKIEKINSDLSQYENFVIVMPVWAGCPAPAFNSLLDILPPGAAFRLLLVSKSGHSEKERTINYIKSRGFEVSEYIDIK